jgi:hypothetical protein
VPRALFTHSPRSSRASRRRHRLLLVPFAATFVLFVAASTTSAAPPQEVVSPVRVPAKAPTVGYDISYPQCGAAFPKGGAFRIVGVNRGIVFSPNPCLGSGSNPSQLAWAGKNAGLYANTGNPGPELSSRWPIGQTTPRTCSSSQPDSTGCAYDYGWNAAKDSYATAVRAYISLGWAQAGATRTPVRNTWWLDVETANSWRSDTSLNVAALRGAVAYLESVDAAGVGFYSAPSMWQRITGGKTAFSNYPTWVAGANTQSAASRSCGTPGFTAGGVALSQFPKGGFDANIAC